MKSTEIFPRLLPGAALTWLGPNLYFGYRERGVELQPSHEIAALIALCDGKHSLAEILRATDSLPTEEIVSALKELAAGGYLTFAGYPPSELPSLAESRSAEKLIAELNLGRTLESIHRRGSQSILIFGGDQLSDHLAILLRASGFGAIRTIDRDINLRRDRKIGGEEVIGLHLRESDIGRDRSELIFELQRGAALSHHSQESRDRKVAEQDFPSIPDFIITTSQPQPDYRARWMSESIPHLLLSSLADHQIEVGPIVLPGRSPCGRCIELSESEVNPVFQRWRMREVNQSASRLSAAAITTIAGTIVLETIHYLTTGSSSLIGASKVIDLHNVMSPVARYWAPHPECGCTQLN